ncbi:MAG: MarR family winged helix-turn-helix transcriptional regulator [Gemmatimonadales bacterium]|nr:MarR family transcriptional regulator [Gemmatimonadota bacterium]
MRMRIVLYNRTRIVPRQLFPDKPTRATFPVPTTKRPPMSAEPVSLSRTLLAFARALRVRQGAALAPHGLHPGQDALLCEIWDAPGLGQSVLADRLGVEPPTVARMVRRLERAGLLERRRDPDDARSRTVYPTPRSRLLEAGVRRSVGAIGDDLEQEIGPAAASRLRELAALATVALRTEG